MEHVEKIITVDVNNINKLALLDMYRILPPIIVANSLFSCVVYQNIGSKSEYIFKYVYICESTEFKQENNKNKMRTKILCNFFKEYKKEKASHHAL